MNICLSAEINSNHRHNNLTRVCQFLLSVAVVDFDCIPSLKTKAILKKTISKIVFFLFNLFFSLNLVILSVNSNKLLVSININLNQKKIVNVLYDDFFRIVSLWMRKKKKIKTNLYLTVFIYISWLVFSNYLFFNK